MCAISRRCDGESARATNTAIDGVSSPTSWDRYRFHELIARQLISCHHQRIQLWHPYEYRFGKERQQCPIACCCGPPATKLTFSADGIICVNAKQWRELSARKIIAGTEFVLADSVADKSIGKIEFESQGWRVSFPLSEEIVFQRIWTLAGIAVLVAVRAAYCSKRKIQLCDWGKTRMVQSQGAAQNSTSRVAYEWYLVKGISSSSVADPSPSLHFHLLANLQNLSQLQALPSDQVEALMRELFDEVRQMYQHSVKKSILGNMVRNEVTRQRVGIASVPQSHIDYHWWEWGSYKLKFSVTAECNNMKRPTFHTELCRRIQSIDYGLKWMDNLTLSISNLWGKYEGLLLVDVPATDEDAFGMKWSSLEISQFKHRQEESAKCTKSIF